MNRSRTIEVLLIVVLAVLAFASINPYWMPMGMQLAVVSALVVLFGVFAVYFWREQGGDEREQALLDRSDRIGFLAGAAVLLSAIVYQGVFNHMESPWIIAALLAMIVAKLAGYIYLERK